MALPETKTLLLREDRGVLHLTFNRAESRNSMSPDMLSDLVAVFEALRDEPSVRAVVMRGAGGWFCAGADLKSMMGSALKPPAPGETDPLVAVNRAFGTMLRTVAAAPQVVIAVCEGAALAGGMGLVCVSDIALAQVDTKFGVPETARGLPPAQIAPFLVERMGLTQVRRLALTGAQFWGAEALRLGLVHELFADDAELDAKLSATLEQVRGCAPLANALTKAILMNVGKLDPDAVLDDAAQKFAVCARSPEAAEGITAFLQKRAPKWAQA
ncbi:MAG TPA: enoyl-CoA hydratase-related protein [Solimonas sp.]